VKRLTLIRHGNADSKDAGVADFDRPLSRRGQSEAEALGRLLLEHQVVPERLLASSARRAQQTAETLARALGINKRRLKFAESLYLARAEDILSAVHSAGSKVQHLAIVGHNPGLSELARMLAPSEISFVDMPTGSACTFTFSARTWANVHAPALRAVQYQVPPKLLRQFS